LSELPQPEFLYPHFRGGDPQSLLRARFVAERVAKMPPREECKDLADFAHGRPASILQCTPCTRLVRAEQQNNSIERYVDDQYDRWRVLKPGGLVLLRTPNAIGFANSSDTIAGR
jgi:hypothetical protein